MFQTVIRCFLSTLVLTVLAAAPLAAQDDDVCFECHNDPELIGSKGDTLYVDSERYAASIHVGNGLECTSCHADLAGNEDWPHPERLERVDCSACHDQPAEFWKQGVHGLPAQEKGDLDAAGCADCHGKHYIRPVADTQSEVYPSKLPYTCLNCHGDPKLAGKHAGMGRAEIARAYLESIHGQALEKSGLVISATCSSCHGSHKVLTLKEFYPQIPQVCGPCHAGIYDDYLQGVHGKAFQGGNRDVPICTDCHGEHNIRSPKDPSSTVSQQKVMEVCSRCHENLSITTKYGLPSGRLDSYQNTFHGVAIGLGDMRVANCASCHGFHSIRPSSDPKSTINPANLAKTCGQCHPKAGENFAEGKIHVQDRPEDNIGAWLVKRLYVIFIAGLIGGFIAYICIDLVAHRRRRRDSGDSANRGEGS
ncbi:MAG TPA: cytochrome c3 family protein [Candidatus Glassbacteria bacterium]|nr:cytochrome c3 family protein [Candidatus Glassbacteria bacterium]